MENDAVLAGVASCQDPGEEPCDDFDEPQRRHGEGTHGDAEDGEYPCEVMVHRMLLRA